ncbi:MAG: recombinase family protein [Acidimicrobiales bacterium]
MATRQRRAAVYARISSDPGDTRLGVARQEADCRDLAQRLGWEVAEVRVDNDISAYSGKHRPGYEALLDDLRAGHVSAVIAWHPDRLHRSPRELEAFIDIVEATGAKIATCQAGDLDLSTPAGRMTARVVGAVSRGESEHKSARITRKHAELATAGKLSGGGHRPFGYEGDRLKVRADEAGEIRDAARAILAGESVRGITQDWRRRGIATVRGAVWSPTTVKRLLCSGRIAGQREHHGVVIGPAVWRAIITPAESARLRAVLTNGDRAAGGTPRSYLLSGLVCCGDCGQRMSTRPTAKGRHRYLCVADRGGCGHRGIDAEGTENLVVEAVVLRLDTPELARRAPTPADPAEVEVEELAGRLDELAEMFAAGEVGRREWLKARGSIESRLQAARRRLQRQSRTDALDGLDGGLRDAWADLSFDRRRAVLGAVVDHIVIGAAVSGRNRFDPERVDVVWRA